MSFLKRLLGSSTNGSSDASSSRPRDTRKNEKYFTREIERFRDIIAEEIHQFQESTADQNQWAFHYSGIFGKYLRLVSLKYSLGLSIHESLLDYRIALSYFAKGWDPREPIYNDMLDMVSLGVLLDISEPEFDQLVQYVDKADRETNALEWHAPDALLGFMLHSRKANRLIPGQVAYPKLYQRLYDITRLPKASAEAGIVEYLRSWYAMNRASAWYDNHTRDRGYKGYWAWEAAAIVKIMRLDDSAFRDDPYYPRELVHWTLPPAGNGQRHDQA